MIVVPFNKFEESINELINNKTKAVILFTSQANQDGTAWCPDCEDVKPFYKEIQEQAKKANLPFYMFIAGDRPTWKNLENVIRKHPATLIASVPTLGYFNGQKLVNKLVDAEPTKKQHRELMYE